MNKDINEKLIEAGYRSSTDSPFHRIMLSDKNYHERHEERHMQEVSTVVEKIDSNARANQSVFAVMYCDAGFNNPPNFDLMGYYDKDEYALDLGIGEFLDRAAVKEGVDFNVDLSGFHITAAAYYGVHQEVYVFRKIADDKVESLLDARENMSSIPSFEKTVAEAFWDSNSVVDSLGIIDSIKVELAELNQGIAKMSGFVEAALNMKEKGDSGNAPEHDDIGR